MQEQLLSLYQMVTFMHLSYSISASRRALLSLHSTGSTLHRVNIFGVGHNGSKIE
jgi:hypothetical protein